jgi:uncharacterized membrane protein
MLSILKRNAKFILTQYHIFSAAYYVAKGDFGHLAMMSTLWFLLLITTVVAIMLEKDSSKDPEG